ncbi:MAG TPA: RluA family pseudouridine synthase [Candidatus Limnocylindria bacterium]|nr:RluA family pseudouridine synthase [Candidatus Limnocylindria bacterium]
MSTPPRRVRFVVPQALAGERLDRVLAASIAGLSRGQARVLLELGGVYVDGARTKIASRPVRAGQRIEAVLGGAFARATKRVGAAARRHDEAGLPSFVVLHEDDDVLVADKPAGLLSAPTPESDRANLLALLRERGRGPVFLVHRLDLPTSGVLVFARTPAANRHLATAFARHDVQREYLALVAGVPSAHAMVLDVPIGGRPARTHVAVVEPVGTLAALVRCRLETGRTHQIRIHLHGAGHPVLGDPRFPTRAPLRPPRLALHATLLGFRHPRRAEDVRFESPWPADLSDYLDRLRSATLSP